MIKLIRRTILVNINDAKTQEETAILNVKFDDFIVFEVKNSFIIKTFIRFEI
jgi:hypothetical protein